MTGIRLTLVLVGAAAGLWLSRQVVTMTRRALGEHWPFDVRAQNWPTPFQRFLNRLEWALGG